MNQKYSSIHKDRLEDKLPDWIVEVLDTMYKIEEEYKSKIVYKNNT